jgi:transposase
LEPCNNSPIRCTKYSSSINERQTAAITQWLEKHSRFELHFTTTSASWLNALEGSFAQLERRALHRAAFTSVADLKAAICKFIEAHYEHSAKPFKWNKTADASLARYVRQTERDKK